MMKNIITIDFDLIMKPSIQLFNDQAGERDWVEFLQMPEARLFRADMVIYRKLSNYVFKQIDKMKPEDIIFIEDHSRVIDFVEEDDKINLINIDHHHDTGYAPNNHLPIPIDDIGCGNWVKWLYDHDNINNYIWIKNSNSDEGQDGLFMINNTIDFNKIQLNQLVWPDKLILCLSEPWVPPHYRPLYYLWQDYFEKVHGEKKEILYGRYKFEI